MFTYIYLNVYECWLTSMLPAKVSDQEMGDSDTSFRVVRKPWVGRGGVLTGAFTLKCYILYTWKLTSEVLIIQIALVCYQLINFACKCSIEAESGSRVAHKEIKCAPASALI